MPHFIRKPLEVDACQMPSHSEWAKYRAGHPVAIQPFVAIAELLCGMDGFHESDAGITVQTTTTLVLAEPGMWIVRDANRQFHVLSDQEFTSLYEAQPDAVDTKTSP